MRIPLFSLGADISQQLAVCLALLGWQLKNSTPNQQKQKPIEPIRLHATSLGQFNRLASTGWMVLVAHIGSHAATPAPWQNQTALTFRTGWKRDESKQLKPVVFANHNHLMRYFCLRDCRKNAALKVKMLSGFVRKHLNNRPVCGLKNV